MTAAAQLSYNSIDEYLGPGETRFFSRGYRRAEYQIDNVMITPADGVEPDVQATVTLRYPRDWSKKKSGVDLPPHLSSVDALVLGAQLSEMYLSHAYGLDAAMRRKMWLRRVTLRAGSAPQEHLEGLPAFAKLRETRAVPDTPNSFVSVFDCKFGAMQARCEIEHEIGGRVTTAWSCACAEDVLGPAVPRYYGEGFKFRRQLIEDVRVDMETLRSFAAVRIDPTEEGHTTIEGIEGGYQPSVSMIDCFVVNLQLAQVLMYEMDAIERKDSNTLWMIRTILEAENPRRPYSPPLVAHTAVTGKHLLRLRGGIWRNTDIVGGLGGVNLRCSLAHELPKKIALATA
ncbi:MAG: AvrD family protein [Egibacteraceae bacterium]